MDSIFKQIKHYLSLIKFSHTIFAMPFAMIGFALGVRENHAGVQFKLLLLVVLCMVFARSAAMAFNRFIDRKFDAANPRTNAREIPAGVIAPRHALSFVILNCLLFVFCAGQINSICFYLSPIALAVVLGYSYTKRFTALCHLILGLGLSLAPIGAYLAVTGIFHLLPILFSITVLTWVGGFDIIYALQDEQFDKSQSLFSIPTWLGVKKSLAFSSVLHFVTLLVLVMGGIYGGFGLIYWIGFVLFGSLLIYQHRIVKPDDLSKVNIAFATTNGIASIVFASFTLIDIFIGT